MNFVTESVECCKWKCQCHNLKFYFEYLSDGSWVYWLVFWYHITVIVLIVIQPNIVTTEQVLILDCTKNGREEGQVHYKASCHEHIDTNFLPIVPMFMFIDGSLTKLRVQKNNIKLLIKGCAYSIIMIPWTLKWVRPGL